MKEYTVHEGGNDFKINLLDVNDIKDMIHTTGNITSLTLATLSDFQIVFEHLYANLTLIVGTTSGKDLLLSLGFTQVFARSELAGKTWTFDNGNSILFSGSGYRLQGEGLDLTYASQNIPLPIVKSDLEDSDIYNGWSDASALDPNYKYRYFSISITRVTSAGFTLNFSNINKGVSGISVWGPYDNTNINEESYNNLKSWWDNMRPTPPAPKEDPYDPGGESGEEGGEGDFDNTSDEIEIPTLPTASTVINTGFITLYDANIYDLNDLASYLWSANGLDLETFKKIFADPISAILGLSIFPCPPEITTQDVNVILGNIDTGVGMRKVTNQYRRYDMGTLNLNEYWGGYLDYSPYTSVEIYLPYIGTRTLNADDVMGKALHLVYNIDFLSGSCCAILEVGGTVLYQFMGQCSCPVPVTGRDMTNLVNGVMSVVGAGVGTLVATGGNAALAGASAIGSLASHVTSSKPKIEKSGAMGGMGGMLGVRKPYLVVTRPRQALPASQNTYTGYPSYMTCMLGDLVGFTVMETVHLQDMSATDEEKAEIDRLLKTGVVL